MGDSFVLRPITLALPPSFSSSATSTSPTASTSPATCASGSGIAQALGCGSVRVSAHHARGSVRVQFRVHARAYGCDIVRLQLVQICNFARQLCTENSLSAHSARQAGPATSAIPALSAVPLPLFVWRVPLPVFSYVSHAFRLHLRCAVITGLGFSFFILAARVAV